MRKISPAKIRNAKIARRKFLFEPKIKKDRNRIYWEKKRKGIV